MCFYRVSEPARVSVQTFCKLMEIVGWIFQPLSQLCECKAQSIVCSVCISGYLLSGYPDLSVNFMAAKNPYILKWKSGCCGCLQKLYKLCLWYCGGTSNYSRSNSHASKEWMVTPVGQTQSKECLLTSFSIYVMYINRMMSFMSLRGVRAYLLTLPLTVSCFSKIQIGLPFWYRLTRVVLDKGPLNGCVCVCYSPCVASPARKPTGEA